MASGAAQLGQGEDGEIRGIAPRPFLPLPIPRCLPLSMGSSEAYAYNTEQKAAAWWRKSSLALAIFHG